jgi:hypothetical protein
MPTNPRDTLAALLTFGLVAATFVLLWFKIVHPGIRARQRVAALAHQMGLATLSPLAFDNEFCLAGVSLALGVACAAGQRHGLRVGILFQPARSRRVNRYSLAIVAWPGPFRSAISLGRGSPLFGSTPTPFDGPMVSSFTAYGPALEVNRVFSPRVQALLGSFPRCLESVSCNRNFTWLTWQGIEADPGVCDQALQLAAEIARVRSG